MTYDELVRQRQAAACPWDVIPQETPQGKLVMCRTIRCFPKEPSLRSPSPFGRLKHPLRRVCVQHDSGAVLVIQYALDSHWTIHYPPRTISYTRFDSHRSEELPGERETFQSLVALEDSLRQRGMSAILQQIVKLLAGG